MDSRSQFLRSVELLSQLSEAERASLSDLLEEGTFKEGEYLWKAGDPADCLILIKHGTVEVLEPEDGGNSARLKEGSSLHVGDFFGTNALLDLRGEVPRRRVGGIARSQVNVFKLNRSAASQLGDLPEVIINNSRVKAMRNLEWFTGMPPNDRLACCRTLPKHGFTKDQTIVSREAIPGQGECCARGAVQRWSRHACPCNI